MSSFQALLKYHLLSVTTLEPLELVITFSMLYFPPMTLATISYIIHVFIYMIAYLSVLKCEPQKEGFVSGLFTAFSPLPKTMSGTLEALNTYC